jgi:hypothetical protein
MTRPLDTAARRHERLTRNWTGAEIGHVTEIDRYPVDFPPASQREDLGTVTRIAYKRDQDGKVYEHEFPEGEGPMLYRSPQGYFYLADGAYSVHGGWFSDGPRQTGRAKIPRYIVRVGEVRAIETVDMTTSFRPGELLLVVDRYDRAHVLDGRAVARVRSARPGGKGSIGRGRRTRPRAFYNEKPM